MQAADGKYEFEGEILARSQKAVKFRGDFWDREEHAEGLWFPKSQITLEEDIDGDRGTILLPAWIAKREHLDEYE